MAQEDCSSTWDELLSSLGQKCCPGHTGRALLPVGSHVMKCRIHCTCSSITYASYTFHPQAASELLAEPRRPNRVSTSLRNRLHGYAVANSFIKLLLSTYYSWVTMLLCKGCLRTWTFLSGGLHSSRVQRGALEWSPGAAAAAGIPCHLVHNPWAALPGCSVEDVTPYLYCLENKWPGAQDSVTRTDMSTESKTCTAGSPQGTWIWLLWQRCLS